MRILRLELNNVRQFAHKRLEFGPGFNLLVGENGAGKSTVLRSLLTVLGHSENFRSADRLDDDDIRHRAPELGASVEYQHNELAHVVKISRRWRHTTRRNGSAAKGPILWFGSNESAARTLQGKKIRTFGSDKRDKQWDRDALWHHEEFFYREMFESPEEKEQAPFGRSELVRRFVGRVLSRFSPKFHRFGWSFQPYDCSVNIPQDSMLGIRNIAPFRAALRAEIMRFLVYDNSFKPGYPRWGIRRTVTFMANGETADGQKRLRPMPEVGRIFSSVAERFKIGSAANGITLQIKLAPRISVIGDEGTLLLSQLSDGEKRIFSMIVDIARQLSLQSGGWRGIESASGLVVIDEIDCHLHPKWQRMIVPALEDLFPSCQFIATTHSPFIIQAVDADQLQSLGSEPIQDFTDRGIEEITFKVMGIEDHQVSPRYLEMLEVARQYFLSLEEVKAVGNPQREILKGKLRALSGRFARNPAFQAFLEMKAANLLGPDA